MHTLGIHFSNSKKVSDKLNFFEKFDVLKTIKNWTETNSISEDQHC